MEKKIIEWLEELPSPIKERAIKNYNPVMAAKWARPGEMAASLREALFNGFKFNTTPEGGKYWDLVYEQQYEKANELFERSDLVSSLRLEVERLTKENEGLRADKKAACVAFAEYVSGDAWEFVDGAWVASEWDGEVYRRIEKTSNDLYSEWAAKTPA